MVGWFVAGEKGGAGFPHVVFLPVLREPSPTTPIGQLDGRVSIGTVSRVSPTIAVSFLDLNARSPNITHPIVVLALVPASAVSCVDR